VSLTFVIVLVPLGAAAILLLTGRRWPGASAGWLASAAVAASFGCSVAMLAGLLGKPAADRTVVKVLYEWFAAGSFHVAVSLRADPLSTIMALTVTGVGTMIFVYAIGYMAGDPRFPRFFAYMSLFVFFMLLLVLADNFLLLYVGWEGVGLCSYLLIGFWSERKAAADAAKKAFIVTRIGDSAMLIGIAFIWFHFHTLEFGPVFHAAPGLAGGTATIMALLLFAGAVGKSAQLPLHTWLPDAMEGPTPVSALIHAATMVTAGVYLVVRAQPIFHQAPGAATTVAVVGVATSIYAGLSAIGQDDIKRVLAYSTISQIGLMLFAAGVGDAPAAIFLLVCHAFFKALLFLSAGSVIRGLGDEQDMMKMGGLSRVMRFTTVTWIVGALAISGIPPLSGFFAKDQVIAAASLAGRPGLWAAALAASLLTGVYVWRATFMTFFGRARYEGEPHEAPAVMRGPMLVLAVAAAIGGVLGLSRTSGLIPRFLAAAFSQVVHGPGEVVLTLISLVVAVAGLALAWFVYGSGRLDWIAIRVRFGAEKRLLQSGFYVDDVYGAAIGQPAKLGAAALAVFDRRGVDGLALLTARAIGALAAAGRRLQTGLVRTYALAFLLGGVGVLSYLVVKAT
jgi:NADH-quinone oxidoreductase subunit L